MVLECNTGDTVTTIARTPANNVWDNPYLPGLEIIDMDLVVHIKDLERAESFVFNVREKITDPIKMIQATHK